jgi:hypothetical protein
MAYLKEYVFFGDRIRNEFNIDIIHAHSYFPAGLASCEIGMYDNIPVLLLSIQLI